MPVNTGQNEACGITNAPDLGISSLATLFVTPSLRARFVSRAPASPWLSGGFGYGLYEGSRVLQNGVASTQIHRSVATGDFGGGIDVRTRLKVLFPIGFRGEVRDFYTFGTPSFGVPVQRSEQHNAVVSGGWLSTCFSWLREDDR